MFTIVSTSNQVNSKLRDVFIIKFLINL